MGIISTIAKTILSWAVQIQAAFQLDPVSAPLLPSQYNYMQYRRSKVLQAPVVS